MSRPYLMLASVLAMSPPIYAWGLFYPIDNLPFGLPGTAVMIVLPAVAASLMTYQESGIGNVWALWWRLLDIERVRNVRWAGLALLTMPAISVAAFFVMQACGYALPDQPAVDFGVMLPAFALYFAGAALEEIGWTGYATEPLQERLGVVNAGLVIGSVWAAWHLVPWAMIQGHATDWVVGQSVLTILMRIVMGHIYARGGRSLFLATLFHTAINTSYSLFPNGGSHYDPTVLSIILGLCMLACAAFRLMRYR
jgi:membrane protease YdiL (CAAX protease family)